MTESTQITSPHGEADPELEQITGEEERALLRVEKTIALRRAERSTSRGIDYDAELIALRDQINEARLEDVPPLIEEMERLQAVAARRAKVSDGAVDAASPYFGRLVLEEENRRREVLIGKATFLDPKTGIRIVDWRDAPVSRIYYRYDEGDDYEENFGGKNVLGEVITRRSVSILSGVLRRIGAPQGVFVRRSNGTWTRAEVTSTKLVGGQGAAMRAEAHHRPKKLGTGIDGSGREDKHLPEIAALIDPRQFELITKPSSGLVVIQGGAGSGKTTIGLHRLAYLAFHEPRRFAADRMLVIVFNDALARYISRVLPALGVPGVLVTTYERWAHRLRVQHVHSLPNDYDDDTPISVVKLKKSPVMLRLIDEWVTRLAERVEAEVQASLDAVGGTEAARTAWNASKGKPPAYRCDLMTRWLNDKKGPAQSLPLASRHALERALEGARSRARDVLGAWSEILTDKGLLLDGFARFAPGTVDEREIDDAIGWCARKCADAITYREGLAHEEKPEKDEDEDDEGRVGVDGIEEREPAKLDREDDTLLLRLVQGMRGALGRRNEILRYEHVFVDEAQDLSPVELAVVLGTVSEKQSVTLAGDTAQRLHLYNGFTDWRSVLADLGLGGVQIEPLRLSYRSTKPIIDFAAEVLGPLRTEDGGFATRDGAPVELFTFAHGGDAVGFLGEALRDLVRAEPLASVAVIARYPEQADLYFKGLTTAEVPNLRRIASQDFPFKAGVDVTDVRQVKGLEFDYVVLVEVSTASYPEQDEARHLLHIAATRAAHQLWVVTTGEPSHLLPKELRDRSL
jgi:DNA helicase-2/ATP-dependent DNA helicase PcrA